MKKTLCLAFLFFLMTGSVFAAFTPTLDLMEYSSNTLAQAAYVTSGASSEVVDQSASGAGTGDYWYLGDFNNTEHRIAQSFILSGALEVTAVEVKTYQVSGSPSGNWTLRIETDSSGYPSGSLANANASVEVTPASAGNSVKGTFATPFTLNASTTYWIKVDCDNQSTNVRWQMEGSTTAYASGKGAYHDGSWKDFYAGDFWFKVYVNQKDLQSYSESTIKNQGSYSLKGIAKQTISLNDTLTRTVSPTIDLSNQTSWKFYIYSASRTGSNIKVGIKDSGGTSTEITPNISSTGAWQLVDTDISGVSNANKDVINEIKITITNADSDNTFYLDYMYGEAPITVSYGFVN